MTFHIAGRAATGATILALGLAAPLGAPAETPAAPAEPTVEQSAILPSAGGSPDGAAPTMETDCQRDRESCKTPLTAPAERPALSAPRGAAEPPAD